MTAWGGRRNQCPTYLTGWGVARHQLGAQRAVKRESGRFVLLFEESNCRLLRFQSNRRLIRNVENRIMTTTHTARRQRTASAAHRTTAHGRVLSTKPSASVTSAQPANGEKPARAVKPMRTPDDDDHQAACFRQLAEHELLTPEDERELSQGIEDTEVLTWERVLARPAAIRPLLALIAPNLEQPVKFPKLQKVLDDMLKSKRARKDDK